MNLCLHVERHSTFQARVFVQLKLLRERADTRAEPPSLRTVSDPYCQLERPLECLRIEKLCFSRGSNIAACNTQLRIKQTQVLEGIL